MAAPARAQRILKDEYNEKGERLFNPTKPHASIFADGNSEAKWLQDGQYYRGDRTPIEGMTQRANDPPKVRNEEESPGVAEDTAHQRIDRIEQTLAQLAAGQATIQQMLIAQQRQANQPKDPLPPAVATGKPVEHDLNRE